MKKILPTLVPKNDGDKCEACIAKLHINHIYMSKGVHDIFVIVINFLSNNWVAKHVTIDLFELTYTSGATIDLKSH